MSEENNKQPTPEEPEEIRPTAGEETAEPAAGEETAGKSEKSARGKKKKEKGYTFTREQVEQMELAAKQLESVKDQFVRLTAEYENYRKRTAKEKDGLYQDARADTVREFLAVYDNLERAAATEGGDDSPHKKGLVMIFHQYQEILKKLAVYEEYTLDEVETGLLRIHVKADTDDVRSECRQLFFAFAEKQKAIVEMVSKKANLEDVFIELTEGMDSEDALEESEVEKE